MHTITLSQPYNDKLRRKTLEAGTYLCEDLTAFEIGQEAQRGASRVEPFPIPTSEDCRMPVSEKPILVVSNCGYGDALAWTPAFRKFPAESPTPIHLCCPARVHCVFDHLPYAPVLLDYPLRIESGLAEQYSYVICSEHIQESSEKGRTMSAIDIRAELLHLKLETPEERKSDYVVTKEEREWAVMKYPNFSRRRIGIQLESSSPTRNFHPDRMSRVMSLLYQAGHELMLLGSAGSGPNVPAQYRDRVHACYADNLTFRQSAAVVATCDVVLAPDSSLLHIAGILGIPAVGLFGSTHWSLRTADYKSVHVIQGEGGCDLAPCWHHPKGSQIFPAGAPCEASGHCAPLNSITPERVVARLNAQYKKYNP
jgi:ADP-heptose:LPS heptosyltransferase